MAAEPRAVAARSRLASTPREAYEYIRQVNEQPWEPLPGYTKVRCKVCGLWYARPKLKRRRVCPDCELA